MTSAPTGYSSKDYRDALAYRIPLYIPPFTVNPDDADRYQALERDATQALCAHDLEGYELAYRRKGRPGALPADHGPLPGGPGSHRRLSLPTVGRLRDDRGDGRVLFDELAYP